MNALMVRWKTNVLLPTLWARGRTVDMVELWEGEDNAALSFGPSKREAKQVAPHP